MGTTGVSILDYVRWNGKKDFAGVPFCEVDALVFSQIIYLPLEHIVPAPESGGITLSRAVGLFFDRFDEAKSSLGVLLPHEIFDLFRRMAESLRYRDVLLLNYRSENDCAREIQFGAITILIPEIQEVFVAFRGTDDTLNGWKEDLNMGYMPLVPSQIAAIKYLENVLENILKSQSRAEGCDKGEGSSIRVRVGGHSKGGNLAVFAAAFVGVQGLEENHRKIMQDYITDIYDFDGPGFAREITDSFQWQQIRGRIHKYVPQFGVVGILFWQDGDYKVVRSTRNGLRQHDALSWEVLGTHLVEAEGLSKEALAVHKSIGQWMEGMDPKEAKKFVTVMYELLGATDAKSLTELLAGGGKNLGIILKTYLGEDENTKKSFRVGIKSFLAMILGIFLKRH
ncbi:MAG: Mbeg1-like protein [Lachnospiraceae bacterium]